MDAKRANPLALALLMARLFLVDHVDLPSPAHDLVVWTSFFN